MIIPTRNEYVYCFAKGLAILLGVEVEKTGFILLSGSGPWNLVPIAEARFKYTTGKQGIDLGLSDLVDGLKNCNFQLLFLEWRDPTAAWLKIAEELIHIKKTIVVMASGNNTVDAMQAPGWSLLGV